MNRCDKICADCPFRRDSSRFAQREWGDPAPWLRRHGWPGFEPLNCIVEAATCLGWAVYLANGSAAMMVASTHRDWVEEWGPDTDLIFDGNGEFIRYHRGEYHGSAEWLEDRKSRFSGPKFNEEGQGILI